jgi:hypothetical protein
MPRQASRRILITALPHLSDDPEELYDEVHAFVGGLSLAS